MKINKTLAALIASAGIGISGQALGAALDPAVETNTIAGTQISNIATFSYKIGGADAVTGTSEIKFRVDQKVDLTFIWNQDDNVNAPVGAEFVLKLKLTNEGNKAQDFKFVAKQAANDWGLTYITKDDDEDSDQSVWAYYEDDGSGSPGVFDISDDSPLTGSDLAVINVPMIDTDDDTTDNNSVTIWAVGKIQDDSADESAIGVEIMARAWDVNAYLAESTANKNTDVDSLNAEYVIFADDPDGDKLLTLAGAYTVADTRDGGYVVLTEILVAAPIVAITKSVRVKSDVLGSTLPMAIPGSIIEYTIIVSNTGTGNASNVTVTDILSDLYKLDLSDETDMSTPLFVFKDEGGTTDATKGSAGTPDITGTTFTVDLGIKSKASATITFDVELL